MKLNLVHLMVYQQLMEWRRAMYNKEDKETQVLGVAGEAWHWAQLTEGDKKFIVKQAAELMNLGAKPRVEKTKIDEKDLTV